MPLLTKGGFSVLPSLFKDMQHPDGSPVAKWGPDYEPLLKWLPILKKRFRYLTKVPATPCIPTASTATFTPRIYIHTEGLSIHAVDPTPARPRHTLAATTARFPTPPSFW